MSWENVVKELPDGIHNMTMDSAIELWNEDNPNDLFSRGGTFHSISGDLENWLIRIVNGKVVGISGFTIHGSFAYVGGNKAREGTKGNTVAMSEEREKWIQKRPKVAGFTAKSGSQEAWLAKLREWKWNINPDQYEGVPEEVITTMKEKYGENWGIKKGMRNVSWENILKKFVPVDEMLITLQVLTEQCMEWTKSEYGADWVHHYSSPHNLDSIYSVLREIGKAVLGEEEKDLTNIFVKLYKLTDMDYDISKLGDELFEAIKWRQDNQ